MKKVKETTEQRLERLRLQSSTRTRVEQDKKKYNRKRAKSKRDWPAFLLRSPP